MIEQGIALGEAEFSSSEDAYNVVGRVISSIQRVAAGPVLRDLQNGLSIVESIERVASEAGITVRADHHEEFINLLEGKNGDIPSFIFYGDHRYTLEPLLYVLGFPDQLKQDITAADVEPDSSPRLMAIGSDMVSLSCPEIGRYTLPVVLRDSDIQFLICKKKFVLDRRSNRQDTNEAALYSAAEYLKEGGNNLVIFPQGFVLSPRWKRGIVRIMDFVASDENGAADDTYLVPVSCNNLKRGDFCKLFLRSVLRKTGLLPERLFEVSYGQPMRVSDFMGDRLGEEFSLEEAKAYMLSKVQELEHNYRLWSDSLQIQDI